MDQWMGQFHKNSLVRKLGHRHSFQVDQILYLRTQKEIDQAPLSLGRKV